MNAAILDGCHAGDEQAAGVRELLVGELAAAGWGVHPFVLRDLRIAYCLGCFGCWVKTPGRCMVEDDSQAVAAALATCELTVVLTPVTFGGFSSEVKRALDRCICLALPFLKVKHGRTHHVQRYPTASRLLAVGLQERPDDESTAIFAALVAQMADSGELAAHASGVWARDGLPETGREPLRELLAGLGVGR